MSQQHSSSRIPLPPLQTSLSVAPVDVHIETNSKLTPHSVTTQHVFVDCRRDFGASDALVRAETGGPGSGSPVSVASSGSNDGTESHSTSASSRSAVNVVVRVRPTSASDGGGGGGGGGDISDGLNAKGSVVDIVHRGDVHQVRLQDDSRDVPFVVQVDAALGASSTQEDVFEVVGWPMVDHCMEGFNSTIFAYGQTGSGKTHTMMGDIVDRKEAGLIPRVFASLFMAIERRGGVSVPGGEGVQGDSETYTITCSFLEIYNEEVTDLLNTQGTNLQIRDGDVQRGVYVQGLSEHPVGCLEDVLRLIATGSENRRIASTNMNERSSRSHSVFTAKIEWASVGGDGVKTIRYSKLNLVDLAGSERVGKSGATGEQLVEARSINKSLSVLGRVISSLVDKQEKRDREKRNTVHVPYRDSKLTFLLQESLGGNSKTAVVATVTPSACSAGETYCTLAFAAGAKKIKCRAVVNEDQLVRDSAHEETIQALRAENVRLRAELDESRVEAAMVAEMSGLENERAQSIANEERVEVLERELEQIRLLFDQNSSVIGMLRAEQSIIQRELVESKATALRATQEASTLRASNVSLSSAFEVLEEENARLQTALDNLREQFVHENGELEQAKTDMASEIERLAADAEREAGSLREKLEETKTLRKKEVLEMQTKMMLLEKDLAHSNDKARSCTKLMNDAAEYKAAAESSKVEIKMLKEKMEDMREAFKAEREKLVSDLEVARESEREVAERLAAATLEQQHLMTEVETLRRERERDSQRHDNVTEDLENRINVERASVAKYKRMVGEISKLVDWAQSNQAGSAAAAAAVIAASNENAALKPSPAAQAALRVARMSLSGGTNVGSILRDAN